MHSITPIVIGLLVLFSIYRRTRKTIGFQKFVKGRLTTRMIMLAIVAVIFLIIGFLNPMVYIFATIGVVLGGIIAYYAIHTTSFELRESSWFYRPNPWIGVLLLVLFVGRIAYRLYQDYTLFGSTAPSHGQSVNQTQMVTYAHDPFTATILFILITYYIVYYTFLIRKERRLEIEGKGGTVS